MSIISFDRTALLLIALTGLLVFVGGMLGGRGGFAIAFVVACATNLYAFWNSDRLALRTSGARAIDDPALNALVIDLARRANMPAPRLFLAPSEQPNAFATGRDPAHAAIVITAGLARLLPRDQLAGVVAHELAHIRNRDTLIMTVAATLAGTVAGLANWGRLFGGRRQWGGVVAAILLSLVAPFAALLVQMAVSRSREFAADRLGAELCGNPRALAQALAALENHSSIPNAEAQAHPANAHLYIVNPLNGAFRSLFSTHPPTEQRIALLEALAQSMGQGHSGGGWSPFNAPAGFFFGDPGLSGDGSGSRGRNSGPWG